MTSNRLDIHNSDIPVICRSCEARHQGVCGALIPAELTELAKHTRRQKFESASELLGENEPVKTYANVIRGVVKLEKMLEDGRQQIVGLKFPPDFLGRPFKSESDLSSVATAGTEICIFPKDVLDRLVEENPAMRDRLHDQALQELDEAREWMLTLGRKTAPEKVAAFIHHMAMHVDPDTIPIDGNVVVDLSLTRAEIADFLGLTIETISRQFTNLRRQGLISVRERTHVTILDLSALKRAAGS